MPFPLAEHGANMVGPLYTFRETALACASLPVQQDARFGLASDLLELHAWSLFHQP